MLPKPMLLHRLTPTDVGLLRQLNALFGAAFADPETFSIEYGPLSQLLLRT